jgi:hypothetical protein
VCGTSIIIYDWREMEARKAKIHPNKYPSKIPAAHKFANLDRNALAPGAKAPAPTMIKPMPRVDIFNKRRVQEVRQDKGVHTSFAE